MTQEKIMVTGGAGMIGSNLVKRLVGLGYKVSVIDNLWRGRLSNLKDEDGRYAIDLDEEFFKLDLALPGSFEHLFNNIDYVFHLADVVAGIGYVFRNEGILFRKNLLINSNVINAARSCSLKGFIYVGTACSYPAAKQTSIDGPLLVEEDAYPAWPESAYGWSKLMGEYESLLLEKETGTPVSVVRLHNVYGTPCDYGEERGQVIPSLIRKAIRYPDEPFVVWGTGEQGRAFVYVDDVIDALIETMRRGLGKGVIQIGTEVCTAIRDIAEVIVEISGKPIEICYDASRPEGDRGRAADYSKARKILNWSPRVGLREGLERVYRWVEAELAEGDIALDS
jgi:nucleoside-diphosphate-sugar epimerase